VADASTTGLDQLLNIRQASLLPEATPRRRFAEPPELENRATSVVFGSKPNGLPPGIALHAEFLAAAAAGLNNEQVLRGTGVNAAAYLHFGLQLGRIAPGSRADLVLVDGDPLANVADLRKVVGVVRNGRFFSAIGLIEQVQAGTIVE
jgi:imidazolonepropionase-like amidohydrolase